MFVFSEAPQSADPPAPTSGMGDMGPRGAMGAVGSDRQAPPPDPRSNEIADMSPTPVTRASAMTSRD